MGDGPERVADARVPDLCGGAGGPPCPGELDPCDEVYYVAWAELAPYNAARIPSDGVLVLQGVVPGTYSSPRLDLDRVALAVTLDGQPIAGALEATAIDEVLVWRPADAWVPGATYQYDLVVMNGPAEGLWGCAPETLQHRGEIVIDEGPGAELIKPMLTATAEAEQSPINSIGYLECCEGAEVLQDEYGCYEPVFDPDECATSMAHGRLAIDLRATPASAGPGADQLLYGFTIDMPAVDIIQEWRLGAPEFRWSTVTVPFCAYIRVKDLASLGTISSNLVCVGEGFTGELGEFAVDPGEGLACDPRPLECVHKTFADTVCSPGREESSASGGSGDSGESSASSDSSDVLAPFDDGAGCGCAEGPDGGVGLLVGVAGMVRRRRSG